MKNSKDYQHDITEMHRSISLLKDNVTRTTKEIDISRVKLADAKAQAQIGLMPQEKIRELTSSLDDLHKNLAEMSEEIISKNDAVQLLKNQSKKALAAENEITASGLKELDLVLRKHASEKTRHFIEAIKEVLLNTIDLSHYAAGSEISSYQNDAWRIIKIIEISSSAFADGELDPQWHSLRQQLQSLKIGAV